MPTAFLDGHQDLITGFETDNRYRFAFRIGQPDRFRILKNSGYLIFFKKSFYEHQWPFFNLEAPHRAYGGVAPKISDQDLITR